MQLIFKFIAKYRYFLLFLFLEIIALTFTIQSHSYHKSRFINSANYISGSFYYRINSLNEFFNLKKENLLLVEENAQLKNLLSVENYNVNLLSSENIDSIHNQKFKYSTAKVINNNYNSRNNYLTLDKGKKHGVLPEMGVVNSKGIIGITNSVTNKYATVISILNSYSSIHVKFKNNDHYGSLSWNGKDYKTVQLLDISRQTPVKVGDTIITGGKSAIFPEGILVGTVKDFEITNNVFEFINITLFNDMSSLGHVNIILNHEKEEIKKLEALNNE